MVCRKKNRLLSLNNYSLQNRGSFLGVLHCIKIGKTQWSSGKTYTRWTKSRDTLLNVSFAKVLWVIDGRELIASNPPPPRIEFSIWQLVRKEKRDFKKWFFGSYFRFLDAQPKDQPKHLSIDVEIEEHLSCGCLSPGAGKHRSRRSLSTISSISSASAIFQQQLEQSTGSGGDNGLVGHGGGGVWDSGLFPFLSIDQI